MWEAIGRLEAIKQIVFHDYDGEHPRQYDLWHQVNAVRGASMGCAPTMRPWAEPARRMREVDRFTATVQAMCKTPNTNTDK